MVSSLIKEISRLISKGIYVLLFYIFNRCSIKEINRYVKHLLLRKTDVLKTSILSERKLEECTSFEEQKGTRYIRANI